MEGNMNVWIVATVTWLCWSSVTVESSRIFCNHQATRDNHYLNKLQADDLTFFVDDPTAQTYSKFLKSLREMLTCYTLKKYNLIVLCSESDLQGQRYTNVVLTYNNVKVTLALLDAVNLNLVAYSSETKSYFFANTERLKNELFQGTKQVVMEFSNSYKTLGSQAAVELGNSALQVAVESLSSYDESTIKTSLIIVIGMVSEAARLKIINNAITENFTENIKQTIKTISYEDKWGELSKNIQQATNGKFPSAVILENENDITFRVTSVGQVHGNMGILKYYAPMEDSYYKIKNINMSLMHIMH